MSKNLNSIENEYVSLWVEDGIIHEFFKFGIENVTLVMAKQIVADRLILSGNKTMPALIYTNDLKSMDKDARDYFSSEEGVKYLSASAIIVDNYVALAGGKLLLAFSKPSLNVELFKSKSKAIDWLKSFT